MAWEFGDFEGWSRNGSVSDTDLVWTVEKGDTLSAISKAVFGDYSHVNAIAEANGISNPNLIQVGQKLWIPGSAGRWMPGEDPLENERGVETKPVSPIPPGTSPILVPLPQPTPPTYELPYTKPITLPVAPPEIPYTKPITLPVEPKPVPSPTQTSVPIFSFLKNVNIPSGKVMGLTPLQWAGVVALGGLAIGLFSSMGSMSRANPRKRKR